MRELPVGVPPTIYVLDANAFDLLTEHNWRIQFLVELMDEGVIELVTNDLVLGELRETPNVFKRHKMFRLETTLAPPPFTWNVEGRGWGQGVWASEAEIDAIKAVANEGRHETDSLILGLAARLGGVLVTSDKRLRSKAVAQSVEVLHSAELLEKYHLLRPL